MNESNGDDDCKRSVFLENISGELEINSSEQRFIEKDCVLSKENGFWEIYTKKGQLLVSFHHFCDEIEQGSYIDVTGKECSRNVLYFSPYRYVQNAVSMTLLRICKFDIGNFPLSPLVLDVHEFNHSHQTPISDNKESFLLF